MWTISLNQLSSITEAKGKMYGVDLKCWNLSDTEKVWVVVNQCLTAQISPST